MKKPLKIILIHLVSLIVIHTSFSQTTSWIGDTDDEWRTDANWTNGVPDDTKDAILGDNNFTGPNQPNLRRGRRSGECKSLTIGSTVATVFEIDDDLYVYGDLIIEASGTADHDNGYIRVQGDFLNSGTYVAANNRRRVIFIGTAQTLGGSVPTTFEDLYIDAGSTVTLATDITVESDFDIRGTLDPTEDYTVSGAADINMRGSGILIIKAATYAENYAHSGGTSFSDNGTSADYASSLLNQTVEDAISYRNLIISGGLTKTLEGNTSIARDLFIEAGTLDLLSFTANRNSAGGSISISNDATLKIGGTNTFPSNYNSHIISSASNVDYYGTNQVVANTTYGNLFLTSSGGSITKTMPGTALLIAGNLTASASAGTLSFTAGNTLSILGNLTLGTASTFSGASFTHSIGGNFSNNGTYNGASGTFNSNGAQSTWSGSGAFNMGHLAIYGNETMVDSNSSLTVDGNFSTNSGASFRHITGGTGVITLSGTSRTISGVNMIFDDLIITGSVSSTSDYAIAGDFTSSGSFNASSGTITLFGSGKSIAGVGSKQFSSLSILGSITTAVDLAISGSLSVSGSFVASAGNVTFNGTSTLSGTAGIFDIVIDNASSLTMTSNSNMTIAGTESVVGSGVFDGSSNLPNTVTYNSSGAQTINFQTFNNLVLTNGNTKTPGTGLTISGDVTIGTATTMNASTYTHVVQGDWINNGTFTAGTSIVQFTGSNDMTLSGATTFNDLTINKGASNVITFGDNVIVDDLLVSSGKVNTGSNSVTITSSRGGNGLIIGTITRTHAYSTLTDYTFEGPNNIINFVAITGTITSITVLVEENKPSTFPYSESINREYDINVTGGIAYDASLRLHYEDVELSGNDESLLTLWNDGGTGTWGDIGATSNSTVDNWVEATTLLDLQDKWSFSDGLKVLRWTGTNGTSWTDAGNWSVLAGAPTAPPGSDEVAVIGNGVFTNHPIVTTAAPVKTIIFEADTPSTLTINNPGSITVGNIIGDWTAGDATHAIAVGAETLTVTSDLVLSNGVTNQATDLNVSSGTVNVNGSVTQSGGADITFSGAGALNIGGDFNYVSGTFTQGSSIVTYNGTTNQKVGAVSYNDLLISKASGAARILSSTTVNGDLDITTGGRVNVVADLDVLGALDLGVGTQLNARSSTLSVGGDWIMNGTFNPESGKVVFNGTGAQNADPTTFNDIEVNKASGIVTMLGDMTVNGDVLITSGRVDADTYIISRSSIGGMASIGAAGVMDFSGSVRQVQNFVQVSIDPASTINYDGTGTQIIPNAIFGNVTMSNGGANSKTMIGATQVKGTLTINTGATVIAPSSTLDLEGDFVMDGTFDANSGTIILAGADNTVNGSVTYNDLIVQGSYDYQSGTIELDGLLHIEPSGDMDFGNSVITAHGDLTNEGIMFSSGDVTFSGLQQQTIRLLNSITSTSTGVINFNGTVAPILNSNSSATLATCNLNNTGGFNSSTPLTVLFAFNIGAGATWNAGSLDHTISGLFTNAGTVNTSGSILFNMSETRTVDLGNLNTTGKVIFGGSGELTLVHGDQNFSSVTVSNTNAAGITIPANWTITNGLLIESGATLYGGTSLTHTISGSWTNQGTFEGETSTVILNSSSGVDEVTGGGNSNFNHLTFSAGTAMNIATSISISGDWTNNATTLDLSNSSVSFDGSGLSSIGGSTLTTFDGLVINKSSNGVNLGLDVNVADDLFLENGQLNLNTNSLTISNPLASAVSRTNGYVLNESTDNSSQLIWSIGTDMDAHVFPFGNASADYIPFTFDLNSGDAGVVSVSTYPTAADNTPYPPTVTHVNASGMDNSSNVVDRFYQIDLSGETSPDADIIFEAASSEVGSITDLIAQRWDGTNWEAALPGQSNTATSVTVPGVTTFSPWALSGNNVPLPVELLSFEGRAIENTVHLNWITASELNNDRFEIYRSRDGKDFEIIGNVSGSGTSSDLNLYQFKDSYPETGISYYRIRQVDYDGTASFSEIEIVDVVPDEIKRLEAFPNPASEAVHIRFSSELIGKEVLVYNSQGKTIGVPQYEMEEGIRLDLSQLESGIYYLRVVGIDKSLRLIVKK